jgi:hypothetical protein
MGVYPYSQFENEVTSSPGFVPQFDPWEGTALSYNDASITPFSFSPPAVEDEYQRWLAGLDVDVGMVDVGVPIAPSTDLHCDCDMCDSHVPIEVETLIESFWRDLEYQEAHSSGRDFHDIQVELDGITLDGLHPVNAAWIPHLRLMHDIEPNPGPKSKIKKIVKKDIKKIAGKVAGSSSVGIKSGRKKVGKKGFFGKLIGSALGGIIGQSELGGKLGDLGGDFLWDRISGNRPKMGQIKPPPIPPRPSRPYTGLSSGAIASRPTRISGSGAYTVSSNSLVGNHSGVATNLMFGASTRTRLARREYITDIVGTTSFVAQQFSINAAVATTFPWLSAIAENFEEYKFHGLVFEYVTLATDYSTTPGMGSVMMATQYNALKPAFLTKQDMNNYDAACDARPCDSFVHPVECAPAENPLAQLYTRTAPATVGDLRLYDLGNFYIATTGNASSTTSIGELWVSYDVELFKPKNVASQGYVAPQSHFYGATVTAGTNPLGATITKLADGIGMTVTGTSITFPSEVIEGDYIIQASWYGSSSATVVYPLLTLANCTAINYFLNGTTTGLTMPQGSTASVTNCGLAVCVNVTGSGASITYGVAGTLPTTAAIVDITVTQVHLNYGSTGDMKAIEAIQKREDTIDVRLSLMEERYARLLESSSSSQSSYERKQVDEDYVRVTPAPRLVGIELNPGPDAPTRCILDVKTLADLAATKHVFMDVDNAEHVAWYKELQSLTEHFNAISKALGLGAKCSIGVCAKL